MNRLTRELASLRQQTASVVSNASSTSAGHPESSEHGSVHGVAGLNRPTSSRRHRSSSSLSSRGGLSSTTGGLADRPSSSGIAPPRDTSLPFPTASHRHALGRHESVASSVISNAGSYALGSTSTPQGEHPSGFHQQSTHSSSNVPASPTSVRSSNIGGNSRLEEISQIRGELESAKRENEVLRMRVRELEGIKVQRRNSVTSNEPNHNMSGTSANQEDDIEVGESALSKGIGDGHSA